MQHIRQELSKLEETLELRSFYAWLEKEEKVGKRCKQLVRNLLESADEDIYNRMDKVILEITKQVASYTLLFMSVSCRIVGVCSYIHVLTQLISLTLSHMLQLSPDIKMFVHNFITEDRDINDEKVTAIAIYFALNFLWIIY